MADNAAKHRADQMEIYERLKPIWSPTLIDILYEGGKEQITGEERRYNCRCYVGSRR